MSTLYQARAKALVTSLSHTHTSTPATEATALVLQDQVDSTGGRSKLEGVRWIPCVRTLHVFSL
jgi:hypothetical protein